MCHLRRGAGAVERGGLENRCALTGTEGSNPSLSATHPQHLSPISGAPFNPAEQARLRRAIRHLPGNGRTSLALSGQVLGGRLWVDRHRFGFPALQGRNREKLGFEAQNRPIGLKRCDHLATEPQDFRVLANGKAPLPGYSPEQGI